MCRTKNQTRLLATACVLAGLLMAPAAFPQVLTEELDDPSHWPEVVTENTLENAEKAGSGTATVKATVLKSATLMFPPDGRSVNVLLRAPSSGFESVHSTLGDLPHPFTFTVLNLKIERPSGQPIEDVAASGLRSCVQMAHVVQLQPGFSMKVRLDAVDGTTMSLNAATGWLNVGLVDDDAAETGDGYVRCELVSP